MDIKQTTKFIKSIESNKLDEHGKFFIENVNNYNRKCPILSIIDKLSSHTGG